MRTALVSEPIFGDKLYQQRARAAFPLLVRQAEAGNTIFYSDLATELGMPNPRNLNFVLGSIGQTMENLSKQWGKRVPPIQFLVVNRATGLPGEVIGWFLVKPADFVSLPMGKRRMIVKAELQQVYAYPYWNEVLEYLQLQPADATLVQQKTGAIPSFGGGESPVHKALKEYVASHPEIVGLHAHVGKGDTEAPLLSGDALDVSFTTTAEWVAAEVKVTYFRCTRYSTRLISMRKIQSRHAGASPCSGPTH